MFQNRNNSIELYMRGGTKKNTSIMMTATMRKRGSGNDNSRCRGIQQHAMWRLPLSLLLLGW